MTESNGNSLKSKERLNEWYKWICTETVYITLNQKIINEHGASSEFMESVDWKYATNIVTHHNMLI